MTHLDVDADGIQRAVQAVRKCALMKLEGLHHITAITGDGPRNVDFYVRVLGLRMVKKTVNQDDPTAYHLFYADEKGEPRRPTSRSSSTPGAASRAGRAPAWSGGSRTASPPRTHWATGSSGCAGEGIETQRASEGTLRFADPEGLGHELAGSVHTPDQPLRRAGHREVPAEHALHGFEAVYALVADAQRRTRRC